MAFFAKNKLEKSLPSAAGYVGVFLLSAGIFSFIQHAPLFRDPDTFYHMKMTMLMAEQGIIKDFIWLPFTTLSTAFTDHHLLYHLVLMPFFTAFGPLMGMKIATIALAAAAITAFYGLLRVHGVRWPWLYACLLATSGGFIFRLNLGKATALSLTLVMLALIVIKKKQALPLFYLSWLYVLLHGGWPIMIIIVGVSLGAKALIDRIADRHPLYSWASLWYWRRLLRGSKGAWEDFRATDEVRLATAAAGGIVTGLIVNPYFPTNLKFYWEQIVQIAVVNYQGTIGVGSEWYPYTPLDLFSTASMAFLLFVFGLTILTAGLLWNDVYRGSGRVPRPKIAALCSSFLLAAIFLCMALRSRRHVEYFVPFALFFDALFIDLLLTHIDPRKVLAKIGSWFKTPVFIEFLVVAYLAFALPFMGVRDVMAIRDSYDKGIPWGKYEKASAWLVRNAEPGDVIVHSDWDDFPALFFRNHGNRYVCGLDPTFCFRHDPDRYWKWVEITTGKMTSGIGTAMKDTFGASYALVEKDHLHMAAVAAIDPTLRLAYEDDEVWIYSAL